MSAHTGSTRAPSDGWPHEVSPFHSGERALQARSGMRERLEAVGRRMVRPFMPDQHRELFAKLPYVFVGSLDPEGRVWATMLTGCAGFVHSPAPETLSVDHTLGPLDMLAPGQRLGVLGIELATRRRNRVNGVVQSVTPNGFSMRVEQSFGNCPQYIQARRHGFREEQRPRALSEEAPLLSKRATELITAADTFFIATTSGAGAEPMPNEGLDVSHRGGLPGFVQVNEVDGVTCLAWPEYRGNYMFCTLGNLERDPRAGLLFVDFSTGTTLRLTGRAAVIEDESLAESTDAHHTARSVLFRVDGGTLTEHAVPYRFSEPDIARELR